MSEELMPCPFCGGEASLFTAEEVGYIGDVHFTVKCNGCFCGTGHYADPGRAAEAWNRRAQQPNEPLTLDELKGMLSEPVWVKSLFDGTVKGAVINNANAAAYVLCGVRYDTFGNYSKTWLAYRSPPEAGEKE